MTAPPADALVSTRLSALGNSVARLRRIVEPLSADEIRASAYPPEWTVADVLSHIGSGAEILLLRLDASLSATEVADDYAEPIWAEWNAKAPADKVADALAADRALVDRLEALTPDEWSRVSVAMGPMTLDLSVLVGLRLNEHVLHTWDVEVTFDPAAALPADAAAAVVDNLAMIVQFAGRPAAPRADLRVHTTDPDRSFTLTLVPNAVSLTTAAASAAIAGTEPDLELAAEAFVRLVYGRLAAHTPPTSGPADLDELRRTFPGL